MTVLRLLSRGSSTDARADLDVILPLTLLEPGWVLSSGFVRSRTRPGPFEDV